MENKYEVVQNLISMGFEENQINDAIQQTGSLSIEVLITFLENVQNTSSEQVQTQEQKQDQSQYQDQTQSITQHVNQEDVAVLLSLGFSKNVSEKSLLMTSNQGTEKALEWISAHKNDADFEEELRMMIPNETKISPAEAALKAKELQRQIRERRKQIEEKDAQERERNRVKSGKALTDARREIDEMKKKHDSEQAKKQRIQDQIDREKMLEQLQRDKEARFGKKFESTEKANVQVQQKKYSPIEIFEIGVKQIRTAQPPDLLPDVAANCLGIIIKILGQINFAPNITFQFKKIKLENILKNPNEPKFRKISITSKVYQNNVEQVFGARNALDGLGFVEQDGFYLFNGNDLQLLTNAVQITKQELNNL